MLSNWAAMEMSSMSPGVSVKATGSVLGYPGPFLTVRHSASLGFIQMSDCNPIGSHNELTHAMSQHIKIPC